MSTGGFREPPAPGTITRPTKIRRNRKDREPRTEPLLQETPGRTAEEIRDAMIVLCDRLVAAIEGRASGPRGISSYDLLSLTKVNTIVSQHIKAQDPLAQKPGETDDAYRKRLEALR